MAMEWIIRTYTHNEKNVTSTVHTIEWTRFPCDCLDHNSPHNWTEYKISEYWGYDSDLNEGGYVLYDIPVPHKKDDLMYYPNGLGDKDTQYLPVESVRPNEMVNNGWDEVNLPMTSENIRYWVERVKAIIDDAE